MRNSVIYIDYNFEDSKYKNRPEDGDAYYTYGFGSLYARQFKKVFPDWDVQCWKADKYAKSVTSKEAQGVKHVIFPAIKLGRFGFYSSSMLKHAKQYIIERPRTAFNVSSFDHLLHFQISRLGKQNPIFVQHHGESPANHKVKNSTGLKNLYWRLWSVIEKMAFSRTSMLYLLDGDAAEDLPVKSGQFRVSTTGVDAELFNPIEKPQARKILGLDNDAQYLLFIGRLNQSKRADMLISAYVKLKNEFPRLGLLIGGCSVSDPLYAMAQEAGATITGMIPQKDVATWLSAADVYSLPLLDTAHLYGGVGMLPVQAMFCHTPVVGSTMKCFPEIDRNNVGVFTNTQDSLVNALRDILLGNRLFPLTRETAMRHYSWKSIAAKTSQDYINAMDLLCR
jgi:glycosyltransferase involved in cell wall biosynthesis